MSLPVGMVVPLSAHPIQLPRAVFTLTHTLHTGGLICVTFFGRFFHNHLYSMLHVCIPCRLLLGALPCQHIHHLTQTYAAFQASF